MSCPGEVSGRKGAPSDRERPVSRAAAGPKALALTLYRKSSQRMTCLRFVPMRGLLRAGDYLPARPAQEGANQNATTN